MEQKTQINNKLPSPPPVIIGKIKYCLYARKSTESEERQVMSIDSQIKEMLQVAERDGLEIVEIRRESHSAKNSSERPVFNSIVEDIRLGKFNGIITWAPDRLSRNAGDLGSLVDLMDQKLLAEIRTHSQIFTNNPNEKFLLMILGSQAKLENDNRGINVRRGLRTRCEMGLRPGTAPTGYFNEKRIDRKCQVILDPERAPIIKKMFEKVAHENWSGIKLYHWMRFEINFRTIHQHHLSLSNIYLILRNTFYYGVFEYPEKSGNWYTGKHEPIIDKDLFDKVQQQLKVDYVRTEKEFAFTKLITCGHCGSGISAREKFKKLKNGKTLKLIYYGCTKSRDKNCKHGFLREEEIIRQLQNLLDKVDIDKLGVKNKFEEEFKRYSKFQRIMGIKEKEKSGVEIDMKSYLKYILREGSIDEKRDLLSCLKSRLVVKNKKLAITK
jgi:site-specific DNA recombinase